MRVIGMAVVLGCALWAAPARGQGDEEARRAKAERWLLRTSRGWTGRKIHPQALLFLRMWRYRRTNPSLRKAATHLAKTAGDEPLAALFKYLATEPDRDLLAPVEKESVSSLLGRAGAGDPLARALRYLRFLRQVDAKRGDPKVALGRLAGKYGMHPWIRSQGGVVAGWKSYTKLRAGLRALPLRTKGPTFVRVVLPEEVLSGWVIKRTARRLTVETLDLERRTLRADEAGKLPPIQALAWEGSAYEVLARGTRKPALLSMALSDVSEKLLWAARADRLKRPFLAARLCASVDRSLKRKRRAPGTDPDPLRDLRVELAGRAWAHAIGSLGVGASRRKVARRLARIAKHFPDDPRIARGCAELIPMLEAMAEEDKAVAAPGALEALSPAARRAHRVRDQGGHQLSSPGGVALPGNVQEVYVKLGWKAIPELIALLDDERPTRETGWWRAVVRNSYYVKRHCHVAERALTRILGIELRVAIQPPGSKEERFRGPFPAFKATAQAWWKRVEPRGAFGYLLDRLDHGRSQDRFGVAKAILRQHEREGGPILLDRYCSTTDPKLRASWIETLAPHRLVGLKPLLVKDTQHAQLEVVVAAARALQNEKDPRGLRALVARLSTGTRGQTAGAVGEALALLRYAKHPKVEALMLAAVRSRSDLDRAVVDALGKAEDSPGMRALLLELLRRPRSGSGVSASSSEGWNFDEVQPKDRAALRLGRLLGETTFLHGEGFRRPAARDAAIAALLKRHGLR